MNRSELQAYCHASQAAPGTWQVTARLERVALPYQDIGSKTQCLAVANLYTVTGNGETHNVIVAVRKNPKTAGVANDFRLWCADTFIEGRGAAASTAKALARCHASVEGTQDPKAVVRDMMTLHGALPASDKCNCWELWRKTKPRELCVHTQHVLATEPIDEALDGLIETLDALLGSVPARVASAPPAGSELARLLFRVPVLLEGDRGSGKTYEAQALARAGGHALVKVCGHEGVEATDLLGHYVPTPDRSLVWKDGGLTQAFRQAAAGVKTVLLIDELLRIPQRQLSVLLTALDARDGHYELRTGRIVDVTEGVGSEEVIRCAAEDLAVVGTTNVGADYAVDHLDPALAERWIILRKDTSVDGLQAVLGSVCESRGFKPALVSQLIRFFEAAQEMKKTDFLSRTPTTRTLVRAVDLAEDETDVPRLLLTQALLWTARDLDGKPVPEQLTTVRKLILKAFPGCGV